MDNQTPATPDAAVEAPVVTTEQDGNQPATEAVIDEPQDVEPKPENDADQPKQDDQAKLEGEGDDNEGERNDDETTESKNQRRRRRQREREAARTKELEAANARIKALEEKLGAQAPRSEDFDTDADYTAALAAYNVRKELNEDAKTTAQTQVETLNREAQEEWNERAAEMRDAARQKYADFNEKLEVAIALSQSHRNDAVDAAIMTENGADIAYYLGNNPQEAREIMSLPPYEAAMQLGRISASLPSAVPKKTTTAPAPITPVKAKANPTPTLADVDDMDEYAKMRGFNL